MMQIVILSIIVLILLATRMKNLFKKWFYLHEWTGFRKSSYKKVVPEKYGSLELPPSFLSEATYRTITDEVLKCSKCGKLKNIVY